MTASAVMPITGDSTSRPTAATVRSNPCLIANSQPIGSTWRSSNTGMPPTCSKHHAVGGVVEQAGDHRHRHAAVAAALQEPAEGLVGLDLVGEDRMLGAGLVDDRVELSRRPEHRQASQLGLRGRDRDVVHEADRDQPQRGQLAQMPFQRRPDGAGADDRRPPAAQPAAARAAPGRGPDHPPDEQERGRERELDHDQPARGCGRVRELHQRRHQQGRGRGRADHRRGDVQAADLRMRVVLVAGREHQHRERADQQHRQVGVGGVDRVGHQEHDREQDRIDAERDELIARALEGPVRELRAPRQRAVRRRDEFAAGARLVGREALGPTLSALHPSDSVRSIRGHWA